MKRKYFGNYSLISVDLLTRSILNGGIVLAILLPSLVGAVCPSVDNQCDDINRSVAYYDIPGAPSGEANCTGTLLNTTSGTTNTVGHHYFLTAYHCLRNSVPTQLQFHWLNNSACGAPPMPSSVSIVSTVYSSPNSDIAVFELDLSSVAANVRNRLYHAGWDVRNYTPTTFPMGTSFKGIHHPQAMPQHRSILNTISEGALDVGNQQGWWLNRTTNTDSYAANGSSGSCLFADTNVQPGSPPPFTPHCIGQLSGATGMPGCVGTNKYGKLSQSWSISPDLQNALDPYSPHTIDQSGTKPSGVNGDPHITTINGIHYDFQGGGEYVVLREPNGLEIQTRQTPIATTFTPGPDPYDDLATCVSLNTAVAARVGKHRVTYQPQSNFDRKTVNLQLRIDGKLTTLNPEGLSLEGGGRIEKTNDLGGLKIDFPDETVLRITPGFWDSQQTWYMNVEAIRPPALDGIGSDTPEYINDYVYHRKTLPFREGGLMAAIPKNSWLPELLNGKTVGPMPESLNERFEQLYHQFGESWRVNAKTNPSLFDYAEGTSTETYTNRNWPQLNGSCQVPNMTAIPESKPEDIPKLKKACEGILKQDKGITYRNCLFDVLTTGNPGFAQTYEETLSVRPGATKTVLSTIPTILFLTKDVIPVTVTVAKTVVSNAINPTGTAQVLLDGKAVGAPATLNPNGNAKLNVPIGLFGRHTISANFIPSPDTGFLNSQSPLQSVTIISYWLLLYLLLGILILVVVVWLWKRSK